jgi:hypothetical protein
MSLSKLREVDVDGVKYPKWDGKCRAIDVEPEFYYSYEYCAHLDDLSGGSYFEFYNFGCDEECASDPEHYHCANEHPVIEEAMGICNKGEWTPYPTSNPCINRKDIGKFAYLLNAKNAPISTNKVVEIYGNWYLIKNLVTEENRFVRPHDVHIVSKKQVRDKVPNWPEFLDQPNYGPRTCDRCKDFWSGYERTSFPERALGTAAHLMHHCACPNCLKAYEDRKWNASGLIKAPTATEPLVPRPEHPDFRFFNNDPKKWSAAKKRSFFTTYQSDLANLERQWIDNGRPKMGLACPLQYRDPSEYCGGTY